MLKVCTSPHPSVGIVHVGIFSGFLKGSRVPTYCLPYSEPQEDAFLGHGARESNPVNTLGEGRIGLFGSGVVSSEARDCKGLSEILPYVKIPLVANAHPLKVNS